MMEQARNTGRLSSRQSNRTSRSSRPGTASTYASESRPGTAYSYGSSVSRGGATTRRTEDEALLRSTMARLDQLEMELINEKEARSATESQLRDLQKQLGQSKPR